MKNVKAAISSWRGSRGGKFEDWGGGAENFRTGGGGLLVCGGYFCCGVDQ